MKTLKIYKSSAGSGKTFTLVLEYLKLVLQNPDDYKAILAITFTNKSAEEMKGRIIEALTSLSSGAESSVRTILKEEFPELEATNQAAKALKFILHDYSSFSVSTIDSFFQRILRALAREIHLPLNMQVKVELDDAILDVTDRLMKEIGVDKELTKWLTDLVLQKMDEEKGWNIEVDIKSVAKELFNEELYNTKILTREEIHGHFIKLQSVKNSFEKQMSESGKNVIRIINNSGLEISDFSYGNSGVAGYFEKISSPANYESFKPGIRVKEALNDSEKWSAKKSSNRNKIIDLADSSLIPALKNIISYFEAEYKNYMTASEILRKIFLFGLVNDLQKKFTEYRNENSIILLSDTTRLLSHVINDNDTPFLYEKTGNRFKHLLIDEFQDTSILQWTNLLPLIVNALGSGFTTLIVGDVKQSIYRWRGGNMNLLMRDIFTNLKQFNSMLKEYILSTNYRSKKAIVDFNNNFFTEAPKLANKEIEMNNFPSLLQSYDADLLQRTFDENDSGGFVKINFIKTEEIESEIDDKKPRWKDAAFKEMLNSIQDLLKKGFQYKDICILVRKNKEGNDIANLLFQNGIEEVISPDSLLITASPKISFLISVFRYLNDNKNTIARSEIIYYYRRYLTGVKENSWHELFSDHKKSGMKRKNHPTKVQTLFEGLEDNVFNSILPETFVSQVSHLGKLPVYELCEQVIEIFKLNKTQDAYTQRFLDLVLDYTINTNSSLEGFLQWWDVANNIKKCSVIVPENINAIRVMTIHSAKGLQFPVVMMPYTDWPLLPKSNELKWMKLHGTPFEELGTVAVSTGNRLRDTYFAEEYENEVYQTVVDNLNLLYVAFTRAEEKLFINCPLNAAEKLNSVSKLIFRTCRIINNDFDGINFEIGKNDDHQKSKTKQESKIITKQLATYPVSGWQEKMTLKTHSGDLLELFDMHLTKVDYGILVHNILAGIQNTNEIENVIDKIVFDGLIGSEEKKHLRNEISEILNTTSIKTFFDEGNTVMAEREILLPNGEVLRPDRVIIKDDHATVIDFKTGRRDKKHEEQVRNYSEILKSMDYKSVTGKIVYLAEREVVNVE